MAIDSDNMVDLGRDHMQDGPISLDTDRGHLVDLDRDHIVNKDWEHTYRLHIFIRVDALSIEATTRNLHKMFQIHVINRRLSNNVITFKG